MGPSFTASRFEEKLPEIKYKGIHEPRGRVKNFRVELRPSNSPKKIWVGTFDSRSKAMRAFDAALYYTGKDPYYFMYPKSYFPPHSPTLSDDGKVEVKMRAKEFADRTYELELNNNCLVNGSKARKAGCERTKVTTAENLHEPLLSDHKWVAEFDQSLLQADYQEMLNPLEPDTDWNFLMDQFVGDFEDSKVAVEDSKVAVEDSKVAVEDSKVAVEDSEVAMVDSKVAMVDSKVAMEDSKIAMEDIKVAMEDIKVVMEDIKVGLEEPGLGGLEDRTMMPLENFHFLSKKLHNLTSMLSDVLLPAPGDLPAAIENYYDFLDFNFVESLFQEEA